MKHLPSLFRCALCMLPMVAHAGTRTSANYNVATEITDAGGRRSTSANYTNDGSINKIASISTVAAPAETLKSGYIGQLFEITGLTLTSATLNLNEGNTDPFGAWQALDDASFLIVPAASVAWSVQSGALTGIDRKGLATAAIVYQDTSAKVQGVFGGFTGTLSLTVKNVNTDDFGLYAGDGIDDAWQVQYFGLNNPRAAPKVDADGSGQPNLFKFLAGLNPLDPFSRFVLNLAPVAGHPTQRNIVFSPLTAGSLYTVQFRDSLTDATWQTLADAAQSDNGNIRTVTDPGAPAARFYRVQVSKP